MGRAMEDGDHKEKFRTKTTRENFGKEDERVKWREESLERKIAMIPSRGVDFIITDSPLLSFL